MTFLRCLLHAGRLNALRYTWSTSDNSQFLFLILDVVLNCWFVRAIKSVHDQVAIGAICAGNTGGQPNATVAAAVPVAPTPPTVVGVVIPDNGVPQQSDGNITRTTQNELLSQERTTAANGPRP